jgi:hypothetical protein
MNGWHFGILITDSSADLGSLMVGRLLVSNSTANITTGKMMT